MLGLHSEYSNYRDNFAEGTLKFLRIIEVRIVETQLREFLKEI